MSNPTESPVLVEIADGIALIRFNRPERLNAWTPQLEDEYFDALEQMAADVDVKVIVVSGSGRGFCAGADMTGLESTADGPGRVESGRPKTFPLSIPKPMIAAINGPCAGIGFVQAVMCDVRFADEGAKMTASFSKLGLIAEHGISWLLAKHVGIGHALDILMSSRVILAPEAASMGLVQRVCPDGTVVEQAMEYARMLATSVSPAAMATIKSQVYSHYLLSIGEALALSDG